MPMRPIAPLASKTEGELFAWLTEKFQEWLTATNSEDADRAFETLRSSGIVVMRAPHVIDYRNDGPCHVYDANGLEWKRLRWVNTETGMAEQLNVDQNGNRTLGSKLVKLATPILIVPMDMTKKRA